MVDLFDLILESVCLIYHGIPLLLEESAQLLIQICQSLCLGRILLNLAVFGEALFADLFKVLVGLLLDPVQVSDLLVEGVDVLLRLLLFALHLDNLVLQLLILEHEQFVLRVQLGNAVQSAVDFNSQRLGSLFDSFVVVRRRFFGAGL